MLKSNRNITSSTTIKNFCYVFFSLFPRCLFFSRTCDFSQCEAQFLRCPVQMTYPLIYNGDVECGGEIEVGIYSFSKSRNRKISLPAAAKSPCRDNSRSRNRLMSRWHV